MLVRLGLWLGSYAYGRGRGLTSDRLYDFNDPIGALTIGAQDMIGTLDDVQKASAMILDPNLDVADLKRAKLALASQIIELSRDVQVETLRTELELNELRQTYNRVGRGGQMSISPWFVSAPDSPPGTHYDLRLRPGRLPSFQSMVGPQATVGTRGTYWYDFKKVTGLPSGYTELAKRTVNSGNMNVTTYRAAARVVSGVYGTPTVGAALTTGDNYLEVKGRYLLISLADPASLDTWLGTTGRFREYSVYTPVRVRSLPSGWFTGSVPAYGPAGGVRTRGAVINTRLIPIDRKHIVVDLGAVKQGILVDLPTGVEAFYTLA